MPLHPHPVIEQIRITELYTLFEIFRENHFSFKGESHNFWECMYIISGSVCISADERVYQAEAGTIVFHKPMEFHKFHVTHDPGAVLFIFTFSAEGPLTHYLQNKVFCLTDTQKLWISSLLDFLHSKTERGPLLPGIYHEYLTPWDKNASYGQTVASYLQQLFLSLSENGNLSLTDVNENAVIFGQAVCYLNMNVHRQPTVLEVAEHCHVSESKIKRIFQKYAGISVHKYLLNMKIKASVKLLSDGESVNDVSEKLGFASPCYFSKAFKRETGVNPSSYRQ